jgi:hypothetical protein
MSALVSVNGHGLTQAEARSLVERIRSHINDARALVLELYENEGWVALGYDSWRECVVAEFDQSQAHLYRLLKAAEVERNISPIGENGNCTIVQNADPIPESVLRPLAGLRADDQRKAWELATANNPTPTAREVEKIADSFREDAIDVAEARRKKRRERELTALRPASRVSPEEIARIEKEELEKSHRQVSTQLFADAVSLFDPRIMTVEALASYLLKSIDLKETSADLSKPRLERALEVFKTIVASWK